METRMNNLATAGPVMDVNRVFDAIAVSAKAATIALAAAEVVPTGKTAKTYPGEKANMKFTVTFPSWANTVVVKAPWNLVLKMNTNSARNRIQDATNTKWVKYPMTYTDWTWGTTCTNTQWGADPATEDETAPVLANVDLACAVSG
jgi:hypothetical protein